MGTDLLQYITHGCDAVVSAASSTINVIGIHLVLSLATIMMVWFGIQEALASAQGGPGFNMGRFLNFVMLISFAYAFVYYYDSAIPGVGYSLTGFIKQGTSSLADTIGTDSANTMLNAINGTISKEGPGMAAMTSPYLAVVYAVTQFMLALLAALVAAIIAYGAIASTIVGLLGPIFIPFMVFEKTEFLFWGWLKAYLSFSFYKVVAAAAMSVLGQFFFGYYQNVASGTDFKSSAQNFPLLLLLIVINIFILTKIPAITASIFSGHAGGHDAGTGAMTGAIMRAM
jgi:type IV secretory pathway VirB6-like protein